MTVVLWMQINSYIVNWRQVYKRILEHPQEASYREGTTTILCRALSRRVQDYPPLYVVEALLQAYPPAAWCNDPLEAACRRRASLPILQLLVVSNPGILPSTTALVALWNAHLVLFSGSFDELIEFICTSGREGAVLWTKLHLVLQSTTTRQTASWKPLFVAADSSCNLKLFEIILDMFPQQARESNNRGCLPLHLVVSSKNNIEGKVELLLTRYREACRVRNHQGRLALHCAISSRQPWSCQQQLIAAWPNALACRDGISRLYPFQLAADCELDTIYNLLHAAPHLVTIQECDSSNKQYKRHYSNDCTVDVELGTGTAKEQLSDNNTATVQALLERVAASGNGELWNSLHQLLLARHAETTWYELHAACAISDCPIGLLRLVIRMHPNQVCVFHNGCLPLHLAASVRSETHMDLLLDSAEQEDEETSAAGRISLLLQPFPQGARMRNSQGLLPLHLGIMANQPWQALHLLIGAWPNALAERSGREMLYPFLLAATCNANLSTVYRLLRASPDLVSMKR